MKNNNLVIFFGIILAILVVLLGIVVNDRNSVKVIVMPGNNVFTPTKQGLVKYNKEITKKIKIKVIDDNRNLTFTYINGEVKFYSGKKEVEVKDDFRYAYTKGIDVKSINSEISDFSPEDINKLNVILKNHGIEGYDNLSANKITYNNQTVYFVTNLFEEYTYDKVFAFVYYFNEDSDIIYLVEKVESTDKIYDVCSPNFNSIIDVNNNVDIVINCDYYSEIGSEIYFYKVNNGNIEN